MIPFYVPHGFNKSLKLTVHFYYLAVEKPVTFKTEIRSGNVDQAATLMNEVVSSTKCRL